MIFTQEIMKYFERIASKVQQALGQSQAKVPYFIIEDDIIMKYECLRSVWSDGLPIKTACSRYEIPRSSYYEAENNFVTYGIAGLFPVFDNGQPQVAELEKFVIMVKDARPSLTNTAIHRIAQAVPITKEFADVETVGRILTSYGCGISSLESDKFFWGRIQRTLSELCRIKKTANVRRDKKNRKKTFFIDRDKPHKRLELLRTLFFAAGAAKIKETCMQYGIPMTSFYRLRDDYLLFGPWAILPAVLPGSKDTIASETQLRVLLEKLKHPRSSGQQIADTLKLKCSRHVVNRVTRRWGLTNKNISPVALQEFLTDSLFGKEKEFQPPKSAINAYPDKMLLETRRMNRHFELICKKMMKTAYHICDPGPILLAPFLSKLGIIQSFELYGPPRLRGKDLTNLALLNIMRIIAGYECINHLRANSDRSVAFASGIGMFGSTSKFYENTLEFKFEQLNKMQLDLVTRAKELGIIDATKVAFDFHFKSFYGRSAVEKGIGKGPDKAGDLVPGFRPHIAWDLARNVIISIAYFQGAARSPRIIRQFCEQTIFPVLDPRAIEEIYMDSEYTKEGDIQYFKETACPNGDVFLCLKKNKQIKKLIKPALDNDNCWEPHEGDDEKTFIDAILPNTGLPLRIVILRHKEKKENVRCFGSTNMQLKKEDILLKYRFRWTIENGIKDLVRSYFIDKILGTDPEKIEFEFYCVMVARMAYEYFLLQLGKEQHTNEEGNKQTLATMRSVIFEKRNCTIEIDASDDIVLTFLDSSGDRIENKIVALYEKIASKKDEGGVLWWGNRKLKVRYSNQYRTEKVSEPIA